MHDVNGDEPNAAKILFVQVARYKRTPGLSLHSSALSCVSFVHPFDSPEEASASKSIPAEAIPLSVISKRLSKGSVIMLPVNSLLRPDKIEGV
ncbi:Uncharacterized protein DAT39_001857 [Clarias magur]|uniref:Uncharacterized protein n=1 Tax=Clarias magur TaxID=1594786 RepID=A0A8J4UQ29_CLAMG|nr:Uncharacterized protein DAT39_001857 [Clarias magur]